MDPGCGGEGGIRTLDGLPHTAFPVRAKPSAKVRGVPWREGSDLIPSPAYRHRSPFVAGVAIHVAIQ